MIEGQIQLAKRQSGNVCQRSHRDLYEQVIRNVKFLQVVADKETVREGS